MKRDAFDASYFRGKNLFVDDGYQDKAVYQPRLRALELKDRDTNYFLVGYQKGQYTSKLKPLYTAFLHSVKLSGYKVGITFDMDPLAAEKNNYAFKTVHACIICNLNAWLRNLTTNFKLKSCLFGETSLVKNSDKEKVDVW